MAPDGMRCSAEPWGTRVRLGKVQNMSRENMYRISIEHVTEYVTDANAGQTRMLISMLLMRQGEVDDADETRGC